MTQPGKRKVAIAVDLSSESAYAVQWAVANYLRPDDTVILLHVQPTSILYGADWGATDQSIDTSDEEAQQTLESSFDAITSNKERVCLEVERLGVNAVIMGSRGFGAAKKPYKARLGSWRSIAVLKRRRASSCCKRACTQGRDHNGSRPLLLYRWSYGCIEKPLQAYLSSERLPW
ncbi:hypothetical protein GOP47_0025709 [Adiantum capillus-veneris]|uniref:UspA domain-containing protein n=1 Tax=Adiantum capillus-veneris TaxID=13818 RepID=A0A9D4U108_ADICA|nr:hypothetical protein GOP47_0025709 [Adiantum capillus-veneris]